MPLQFVAIFKFGWYKKEIVMNKQELEAWHKKTAKQEKQDFKATLPMSETLFVALFHRLTQDLEQMPCQHDLTHTRAFLAKHSVKHIPSVIEWLANHGAGCDCEVILNTTEYFDDVENTWEEPLVLDDELTKRFASKRKINQLQTDFGFCIHQLPKSWRLYETGQAPKLAYQFEFGKGLSCLMATLERSFVQHEWDNDDDFLTHSSHDRSRLVIQRGGFSDWQWVAVSQMDKTPVRIWLKPIHHDWYFLVYSELRRYQGDLKELEKLAKAVIL